MTEKLTIEEICMMKANMMLSNGLSQGMDLFQLTDLLLEIEAEKIEKQQIEDEKINFNDEIVSIEDMGELETIDISVTGDQLFYCNGILTKNSMGITHTADAIFALITSEELEGMGQLMIKQLKNRWGDLGYYRRFVIGIDRSKMKLFNLEESAQNNIQVETKDSNKKDKKSNKDNESIFDKTSFGEDWNSESKFAKKKKMFEIGDLT